MEVEIFVKCEQCHFRFRLKTKLRKHMSNCKNKFKKESRCLQQNIPKVATGFRRRSQFFFDGFLKKRVNVCRDKIRQNNA